MADYVALPPSFSHSARLTWVVYSVFSVTFGILLGAVSPTIDSVPYVLSICWNLFCALSWALVVCASA